jgi:short-subunit dehydrogenase
LTEIEDDPAFQEILTSMSAGMVTFHASAQPMRDAGHGTLVGIAMSPVSAVIPGGGAYLASKAACIKK